MQLTVCYSKIHRATVTNVDLNYVGSVTIDRNLLRAAGIRPYEQVHVLNLREGSRIITYALEGEAGSGAIQINGAAAHLFQAGDLVIVITYRQLSESELKPDYRPRVVFVDTANRPVPAAAAHLGGVMDPEMAEAMQVS